MSRRYTHSGPHIRTNFSFGDNLGDGLTTYDKDYRQDGTQSSPPSQGSRHAPVSGILLHRRCNKNHENLVELWQKMPTTIPCDVDDVESAANVKVDERKERKKSFQKTNFRFGNDVVNRLTTYNEMVDVVRDGALQPPCSPPLPAEIVPPGEASRRSRYRKSILQKDFAFYGPRISRDIFQGRVRDLEIVKMINQNDSLALASSLASKRPYLSCSRLDYRHPLERVRGNTKLLMMQTPPLANDSIWSSVNGRGLSENRTNFTWPSASEAPKSAIARPYVVH